MSHIQDPKITVKEALSFANGNQARLAKMLGIHRVSVHEWVSTEREHLPPLQAYRFREIYKNTTAA